VNQWLGKLVNSITCIGKPLAPNGTTMCHGGKEGGVVLLLPFS